MVLFRVGFVIVTHPILLTYPFLFCLLSYAILQLIFLLPSSFTHHPFILHYIVLVSSYTQNPLLNPRILQHMPYPVSCRVPLISYAHSYSWSYCLLYLNPESYFFIVSYPSPSVFCLYPEGVSCHPTRILHSLFLFTFTQNPIISDSILTSCVSVFLYPVRGVLE